MKHSRVRALARALSIVTASAGVLVVGATAASALQDPGSNAGTRSQAWAPPPSLPAMLDGEVVITVDVPQEPSREASIPIRGSVSAVRDGETQPLPGQPVYVAVQACAAVDDCAAHYGLGSEPVEPSAGGEVDRLHDVAGASVTGPNGRYTEWIPSTTTAEFLRVRISTTPLTAAAEGPVTTGIDIFFAATLTISCDGLEQLDGRCLTNQSDLQLELATEGEGTGREVDLTCALDGTPVDCADGTAELAGLAHGAYSFSATVTDPVFGHEDEASKLIEIDKVAPSLTVDPISNAQGTGPQKSATVAVAFTGSDPNLDMATAECAANTGTFGPCAPGHQFTLNEGAHTISVRVEDRAGNVTTATSNGFKVDATPPTVTIQTGPVSPTKSATATFTFTANDGSGVGGVTFQCALSGPTATASTPCTSPATFSGLADGAYTFSVTPTDGVGNGGAARTRNFTLDTVAPTVVIISGPSSRTRNVSASFAFDARDDRTNVASAVCTRALNSNSATPFSCSTSGASLAALAEGGWTLSVAVADGAGNVSAPATWGWTIDRTGPAITLGLIASPSQNSRPTLSFTATDVGGPGPVTATCQVDSGIAESCSGSYQPPAALADGPHAITVTATDDVGNSSSSTTNSFVVDTTPPGTFITSAPSNDVEPDSATFEFAAGPADGPVTFECRIDSGPFVPCASPATFEDLADGIHRFRVFATDEAGNADPTPALHAWVVDQAPVITLALFENTGGVRGDSVSGGELTNDATPEAVFSASEAATFTCRVDDGPVASCTSPVMLGVPMPLADGAHTLTVSATDNAPQTTTTSLSFVVDVTGPSLTVSAPAEVAADGFTFSITADDLNGPVALSCAIDGGAPQPCSAGSFDSSTIVDSLDDGAHTLTVTATDAPGNETTDISEILVDTVGPITTIGTSPDAVTNATSASFDFVADDGAGTGVNNFECKLDNSIYAACVSPVSYSNLSEGAHTFAVRAVDDLGNVGTPDTAEWAIDLTSPNLDVTVATPTNDTTPTFSIVTEADVVSIVCVLDAGASGPCSDVFTPGSPLADGTHTLAVTVTDAAGNDTEDSADVLVDTVAPVPSITSPSIGVTNDDDVTFTFTADDSVPSSSVAGFACRVGSSPFADCISPFVVDLSETDDGDITFEVRAADHANNASSTSETFTRDTLAPSLDIDALLSPTAEARPEVTFTPGSDATAVTCVLRAGDTVVETLADTCTSPAVPSADLVDGTYVWDITVEDEAGNQRLSSSGTFVVDRTGPSVSISTGPAEGSLQERSFTFTVASPEAGVTLQCRLAGGSFTVCTGTPSGDGSNGSSSYTNIESGSVTFEVRAIDALGNVGVTVSRSFTVNPAPVLTFILRTSPGGTEIQSGDTTSDSTPEWEFSDVEGDVTFTCWQQGPSGTLEAPCTSPRTTQLPLGNGTSSLRVTATETGTGRTASLSKVVTVQAV